MSFYVKRSGGRLGYAFVGPIRSERQALREVEAWENVEQCEPLIVEWLESDDYRASRKRAAAAAVTREFDAPSEYTLKRADETLQRVRPELAGP